LNFLKSLNDISIDTISNLTDSKINKIFIQARWDNQPICIHCGSFKRYNIKDKNNNIIRFKCKDCHKHFSITSDTLFDNHKLPLRKYLLAILLFVNSVKGISSLQLARDLNISNKVAYVILHKIRVALFRQYELLSQNKLRGTVQIDGAYINHKPKQANKKKDRIDRRKAEYIDQQCIITMREIDSDGKSYRTYAFITKSENKAEIEYLVDRYIERGSFLITDEHSAYKSLQEMGYETDSVNHSVEYESDSGINTNQAESYFSRLRRMVIGQHHRLSNKYLDLYVNEITYRENMRIFSNKEILIDLLEHCMKCDNSTIFNGYNQRYNGAIKHFKDF